MLNRIAEKEASVWGHLTSVHSQIFMEYLSVDTMAHEMQPLPSRMSLLRWWDREVKRWWQYSVLRKKLGDTHSVLWDHTGGARWTKADPVKSKVGQEQSPGLLPPRAASEPLCCSPPWGQVQATATRRRWRKVRRATLPPLCGSGCSLWFALRDQPAAWAGDCFLVAAYFLYPGKVL